MKVATALLLAACDSKDAAPEIAPVPRFDLGSCSLDITTGGIGGDRPPVTVTDVTPGGDTAAQLSYWGDKLGSKEGLVIRCAGTQAVISFTAREQTRDMLPPAPRKYAISPVDRVVEVAGQMKGMQLSMTDGSFEITALDGTHVAGTFALRTVFSHDRSRIAGKVKGQFDFKCPHAPCRTPQR